MAKRSAREKQGSWVVAEPKVGIPSAPLAPSSLRLLAASAAWRYILS